MLINLLLEAYHCLQRKLRKLQILSCSFQGKVKATCGVVPFATIDGVSEFITNKSFCHQLILLPSDKNFFSFFNV